MFILPTDVILAYARIHVKDVFTVKMDPGSISLSRKVQDDEWIPDPVPCGRVRNDDICCPNLRDRTPAADGGFVFMASPRLFGVPPCVSPPPYARNPMLERSFLFTNGRVFLR
jgi:hypothetical protein